MLDLRKTKKKVRHRPQTRFEPEISQVRSKQFTTGLLVLMLKNMGRALLEAARSGARGHGGDLQVIPDLAFEDEPRRDGWCQRCALEQRTNDGWCDGRGRFEVAGIEEERRHMARGKR
jgi:hypothetical protein